MVAAEQATGTYPALVRAGDRTPPFDTDAEAAVLSAVLLDPTAMDQVQDLLRQEHFYSEAHTRIFEAAAALRDEGGSIDVVLVATRLRDTGRLAQVGGMPYLTEVLGAAPAVANVRRYAQIVVDKWRVRQAIRICQKHAAIGFAEYGEADGYVQALAADVHELACAGAVADQTLKEILVGNIKRALAASQSGRMIRGLATGFDRLDRLTGGFEDGDLVIVAGRPGMGKSSLVLNIAEFVAAEKREDGQRPNMVQLFSLEMPHAQIVDRMLCSASRVDLARLRTGMLSPTDWSRLTVGSQHLSELDVMINDQSALSVVDVRAKSRRAQSDAQARGRKLALVVVDYLQLMSGRDGASSREQEISEISRGLKRVAKELMLPVIALSQLNRAVETRGEKSKRPQLSDLRESGAIEQDADVVCFIYRDDYYNKDSQEPGIAELIVAKQRNGPTGTVKVKFDSQYTRFDNLPDGWAGDEEGRYG